LLAHALARRTAQRPAGWKLHPRRLRPRARPAPQPDDRQQDWLAELERKEQERSGIRSLKVRFTSVFGYYIEVTKANLANVPSDYIRKQTTVGGERYVTEELKLKEKEIFSAEEKSLARELELFGQLVASVLAEAATLTRTAEALAELDVLAGWAVAGARVGLLPART